MNAIGSAAHVARPTTQLIVQYAAQSMATTNVVDATSTRAHGLSRSLVRGVDASLAQWTGGVGGYLGEGGRKFEVGIRRLRSARV
jgi:hypothetical protein